MREEKNIVYSCDKNYYLPLCISVFSICSRNLLKKTRFHIINKNFSRNQITDLKNMIEKHGYAVSFYTSPMLPDNILVKGGGTEAKYYRLCAASILPSDIDRVLYLDCDTLILRKLDQLYCMDMKNNIVCGVQDIVCKDERISVGLGKNERYINSGVLLINLNEWRKQAVGEKGIQYLINNNKYLAFSDQGVINHICKGKTGYLHPKYNVYTPLYEYSRKQLMCLAETRIFYSDKSIRTAVNQPAIIHFTGAPFDRPWNPECRHPEKDTYLYLWKESGFLINLEKEKTSIIMQIKTRLHHMPFSLYLMQRKIRLSYLYKILLKRTTEKNIQIKNDSIR